MSIWKFSNLRTCFLVPLTTSVFLPGLALAGGSTPDQEEVNRGDGQNRR
jgi:hypothetical protein